MKNYFNGITEEMIKSQGMKSIAIINERKWNPRMIIVNDNNSELIIDGDKEISEFLDQKFKNREENII